MAGTPRDIATLESWFQSGDKPTQQQFYDFFASFVHYLQVKQTTGSSTSDVMSQKAVTDALDAMVLTLESILTTDNDAGGLQIKNMADPTDDQDADTKAARNAAINALKDGVPGAGDTLNKLYNLIVSVGDFAGDHNASTGLPTTGTGASSAIDKGDYWLVTAPGNIVGFGDLKVGDVIFAKIAGADANNEFFYLPFASLVNAWSTSAAGIVEKSTQAEAEAIASAAASGDVSDDRALSERGVWWFWAKVKTVTQTISALWTFAKAKFTHGAFGYTALTDAANIAWNADTIGNLSQVTLGGNRTLDAITNPQTGGIYVIRVVQDGTGGRTLAFNAAFTFPNGITPVLNAAAAAVTVYQFFYDGTNFRYMGNNGALRVTDILVNNQIQSGKKVGMYIDTDGTLRKVAEGEYNSTNKSWVFTGVDNSGSTIQIEWINQALGRILALYNDQHIEVGGSTMYIKVGASVASGDAKIEFLDNKALALILGTSGQNHIEFVTTTGGHKIRLKVDLEHDSNGSTYIQVHFEATTSTTASAVTTIGAFPLPAGKIANIWSSWLVTETGVITGGGIVEHTLKNLAGTTSEIGAANAPTPRRSAGDFTFDINADDTNDTIDFDFTNSSASNNKAYKVNIHAEIHLTSIAI